MHAPQAGYFKGTSRKHSRNDYRVPGSPAVCVRAYNGVQLRPYRPTNTVDKIVILRVLNALTEGSWFLKMLHPISKRLLQF